MPREIITLTTDFGLQDAYVAAMKGVILGINPDATIVDVSHDVPPQDVAHAAYVLAAAYRFFPLKAIHVAVVDPGVGTSRRPLLLTTPKGTFVGPDNGVLTHVLREHGAKLYSDGEFMRPLLVPVAANCTAYALDNPKYWLHSISSTFHGRDIFSPVAANLSLGVPPEELGHPLAEVICLTIPEPRSSHGAILGLVIHRDHFGNLITNIGGGDLPPLAIAIEIGDVTIDGLSPSYAQGGRVMAIIGSHRHLEISVPNGSAAEVLGADVGEEVRVYTQGPGR